MHLTVLPVSDRAWTLRLPTHPDSSPKAGATTYFLRLLDALSRGDLGGEQEALDELKGRGFRVDVDPANRVASGPTVTTETESGRDSGYRETCRPLVLSRPYAKKGRPPASTPAAPRILRSPAGCDRWGAVFAVRVFGHERQ